MDRWEAGILHHIAPPKACYLWHIGQFTICVPLIPMGLCPIDQVNSSTFWSFRITRRWRVQLWCGLKLQQPFTLELYIPVIYGIYRLVKNGYSNRFPEQHCICFSANRSFKRWPAVCSLEDSRLPRDVSLSPTGMVGGVFAPADRFQTRQPRPRVFGFIVKSAWSS